MLYLNFDIDQFLGKMFGFVGDDLTVGRFAYGPIYRINGFNIDHYF
jgi:hypothetical protein